MENGKWKMENYNANNKYTNTPITNIRFHH
jgi:hypothetical protein